MTDTLLTALKRLGSDNVFTDAGKYWSANNAAYAATNPSMLSRVGRAINPMTGFGSAMGAMHDAASNGLSPVDTAIAAAQAIPAFGALKLVTTPAIGTAKAGYALMNDWGKAGAYMLTSGGLGAVANEMQANERKK